MQEVVTALTSAAGTGGICFLIFKVWFEKACAKQLETHKAQLSRENEFEIASFKHKLELAAAERHVQYSRVFDKTAEVIAETYGKLLALKNAADDYTQLLEPSDPSRPELARVFRQKTDDFLRYFLPKKIYIPKGTAERIRVFHNTLHRAAMQFSMAMAVSKSPTREPDTYGKLFDNFFKSSDEVPRLLELLEDDFQRHLGFEVAEKSAK